MPLHDWRVQDGWPSVHICWIVELLRSIKPQLPPGYRAFINESPRPSLGSLLIRRPDVGVATRTPPRPETLARPLRAVVSVAEMEPDAEVTFNVTDVEPVISIVRGGRLVSSVEVVSPRNKDRPDAREAYTYRYAGYLIGGVHLALIDVFPNPRGFSFPDAIAADLGVERPACPAPSGVGFRVGDWSADGGRRLAYWQRPFQVGEPLPILPLPLSQTETVALDLEATYGMAALDADLD